MRCDDENQYVIQTVMGKEYRVEKNDAHNIEELKIRLEELSGISREKQIIIVNQVIAKPNFSLQNVLIDDYICILAQIADGRDNIDSHHHNRPYLAHKIKGQKQKDHCHYHESLNQKQINRSQRSSLRNNRALSKQDLVKIKLENLVDKRKVQQMMEMGYNQEQSTKSLRACFNQLDLAVDYLQTAYSNRKYSQLELKPASNDEDEKRYLLNAFFKSGLWNSSNLKDMKHFYLFAASMKQTNPQLYEIIVKNMSFLELQVNKLIEKGTWLPKLINIEQQTEIKDNHIYSFNDCRAGWKGKLLKDKDSRFIQPKVNNSNQSKIKFNLLNSTQKNKDHILEVFLCSPAWNKIRQELVKHNDQKFIIYFINKLRNKNPILQSLIRKENESSITSLLFGVKITKQIIYRNPICDTLRIGEKKSQKEKEKMDNIYCSYVDQTLVDILVSKRVDVETAITALRANKNHILYAVENILMGGVFKKPTLKFKNESEQANYLRQQILLQHFYCNTMDEFNILVASWKETDPTLYEIVLRYQGVFEFCSPYMDKDSYYLNQIIKSRQSYRKKFIKFKSSIEEYYKQTKRRILIKT